jgi:GxxExxY protein
MINDVLFKDEAYAIIGAAFEVHKELKHGFLEPVYQQALAKEFRLQDIPFEREALINIYYKGERLDKCYKADFICYDDIVIELKALSDLSTEHESQLINYLKATKKTRHPHKLRQTQPPIQTHHKHPIKFA